MCVALSWVCNFKDPQTLPCWGEGHAPPKAPVPGGQAHGGQRWVCGQAALPAAAEVDIGSRRPLAPLPGLER